MKLKITSDGTTTHVVNAETGEAVDRVRRVEFLHDALDHLPVARIEIVLPEADVTVPDEGVQIGPLKPPPFLVFTDKRLSQDGLENLRNALAMFDRGDANAVVVGVFEPGVHLYQLVDGAYRKVHQPEAEA